MDFLKRLTELVSKYRYAVLVLVLGLILMLLPTSGKDGSEQNTVQQAEEQSQNVALELSQILSQIEGVGEVEVMLTVETGAQTVYQYDESSGKTDTVIVTDENRAESGLIRQIHSETYRGAIVVCQGADSAAVRLRVIEAVSMVTGLRSDQISVLKMK